MTKNKLTNQLKDYIRQEVEKLNYKKSIKLENVYPSILEDVLGDFEEPYELNGYDCDYLTKTDKYKIDGCMRFGIATISLLENEEKDEENIQQEHPALKEFLLVKEKFDSFNTSNLSLDEIFNRNFYYFEFHSHIIYEGCSLTIYAESQERAIEFMDTYFKNLWLSVSKIDTSDVKKFEEEMKILHEERFSLDCVTI